MKYRKRPVVIEAIQWDGKMGTFNEIQKMVKGERTVYWGSHGVEIRTLEGDMLVSMNDYVIVGVKGEVYPCKPDIFEVTYDPA